jgi:pSer/pThr/pTyr-binding forkhead associated (FHA) protein
MKDALLLKVGKALDNDIVLNIPFISDYHLEIFKDVEGNVFMTDLNSLNGTFVNGNRLKGFVMLVEKDEVFLGSGFRFQWEQVISNKAGGVYTSVKQNEPKKQQDRYSIKSVKSEEKKVKKPFLLEHLDIIIIYGLIVGFLLYFYYKVN